MNEQFPGGATSHVAGYGTETRRYSAESRSETSAEQQGTKTTVGRSEAVRRDLVVLALIVLGIGVLVTGVVLLLGLAWGLVTMGVILLALGLLLGLQS